MAQKYDHVIIGKNYLSLMSGIELSLKGKSVLILSDRRYQLGDLSYYYLSSYEKYFLQIWGERTQIRPMKSIAQYLTPFRLNLFLGKKWYSFQDDTFLNLKELERKIPQIRSCFSQATCDSGERALEINEMYQHFNRVVASSLMTQPGLSGKQMLKMFLAQQGSTFDFPNISSLYQLIQKDQELLGFFRSVLAFYQRSYIQSPSQEQLFWGINALLSPLYLIDKERFEEDLLKTFMALGGRVRESEVVSWQFGQQHLESLEMNHFDGVICPNDLMLVGYQLNPSFPMDNQALQNWFVGLKVTMKIVEGVLSDFWNHSHGVFIQDDSYNGMRPLSECRISNQFIEFWYYVPWAMGQSEIYYQKELIKALEQIRPKIANNFSWEIIEIKFDRELLCGAQVPVSKNKKTLSTKLDSIKNVFFSGPLYDCGQSKAQTFCQLTQFVQ